MFTTYSHVRALLNLLIDVELNTCLSALEYCNVMSWLKTRANLYTSSNDYRTLCALMCLLDRRVFGRAVGRRVE